MLRCRWGGPWFKSHPRPTSQSCSHCQKHELYSDSGFPLRLVTRICDPHWLQVSSQVPSPKLKVTNQVSYYYYYYYAADNAP